MTLPQLYSTVCCCACCQCWYWSDRCANNDGDSDVSNWSQSARLSTQHCPSDAWPASHVDPNIGQFSSTSMLIHHPLPLLICF